MRTKEWRAYRIETRVPFNFESCENENVELRKTMDEYMVYLLVYSSLID